MVKVLVCIRTHSDAVVRSVALSSRGCRSDPGLHMTLPQSSLAADTGYPHDGRADNTHYLHDRRADKRRYPHDRKIDIQMLKMSRNGYILS